MTARSIALVLAYGEPREGFFPDTLLAHLGAVARRGGHRAALLRAYYDGRDPARDAEVARRVTAWLEAQDADVVVVDRVVRPDVFRAWARAATGRVVVYVTRGESFDPVDGVDLVLGALPGMNRRGATRRTPSIHDLAAAFDTLLRALGEDRDPLEVPGVSRLDGGALTQGPPLPRAAPHAPFDALVAQDVICATTPPRSTRRTLFGNVGCPFADDPLRLPIYQGLTLPPGPAVARLGCAFCELGGDYEKRPDADVVAETLDQARFWSAHDPAAQEFVLSDQAPLRYLPALLRAARDAGLRPMRWLFAARADTFVRERARVEAVIEAARETGQRAELYLSGFEAFSDAELARYNKGVTVREQLEAVTAMRDLAQQHPDAFSYASSRGHSLILWSPWTTPEDIADSVAVIRANGLGELFHEPGRNRLRLYEDLPIYYAAARDGALRDAWEDGDEGAGARKGYNPERPWRFLDARTRRAHDLTRWLREALGAETELAQLAAAAAYSRDETEPPEARVREGVEALRETLRALLYTRPPGAPARGRAVRATPVRLSGPCNNRCAGCAHGDTWRPDDVLARVVAARAAPGPILFVGREPTLHPALLDALARARGDDRRDVAVATNGRRFAYPAFARAALDAGLSAGSVKLFGVDADTADAITGAVGSFAQAVTGARTLRAAGLRALELRACAYARNLDGLHRMADLARRLDIPHLRLEVALDAVGLANLHRAADAVDALARRCAALAVTLDAHTLEGGPAADTWIPDSRGL
jgi:hypothetical protein